MSDSGVLAMNEELQRLFDSAAKPRRSPEDLAARREAIRAAYNKPVAPHEETEQVFVFDTDKPLINRNH